MKISIGPSRGWLLREAPFPQQATFVTPLTELPEFVGALLKIFKSDEGILWIEQIVFEPKELIWYLRGRGFKYNEGQLSQATIQAEGKVK